MANAVRVPDVHERRLCMLREFAFLRCRRRSCDWIARAVDHGPAAGGCGNVRLKGIQQRGIVTVMGGQVGSGSRQNAKDQSTLDASQSRAAFTAMASNTG